MRATLVTVMGLNLALWTAVAALLLMDAYRFLTKMYKTPGK